MRELSSLIPIAFSNYIFGAKYRECFINLDDNNVIVHTSKANFTLNEMVETECYYIFPIGPIIFMAANKCAIPTTWNKIT